MLCSAVQALMSRNIILIRILILFRNRSNRNCISCAVSYTHLDVYKRQTLLIVKSVEFGVYLAEDMNADTKHQVLLPTKQVPAGTKAGDKQEVFIYKDSKDRLIATTRRE